MTNQEKCCDTCGYKEAETVDHEGARMVDCAANERQLYAPYAEDCVKWTPDLRVRPE